MTGLAGLRTLGAALWRAAMKTPAGMARVSAKVIGRWAWQPPGWVGWIGARIGHGWRYLAEDAKRAVLILLAPMALIGGWFWYLSRPAPHYVTYAVTAPGLTEYGDKGISSIKPLTVEFSESAAPLAASGEDGRLGDRHFSEDGGFLAMGERQATRVHAKERLAYRPDLHRIVRPEGFLRPGGTARRLQLRLPEPALLRKDRGEPVLPGPSRPPSQETGRHGRFQPSGRHRRIRAARVSRAGERRRIPGIEARQPELHRRL